MNMWDTFLTTKPSLLIGQQVDVIGKYEDDWRDAGCVVTGMNFSAVTGRWNISIMPKVDILAGFGETDGFTEDELRPIHLKERDHG